jgi:acetyl esterase
MNTSEATDWKNGNEMAKEQWHFFLGMLVILVPVALILAVKKFDLLKVQPGQRITYKVVEGKKLSLHAFAPQKSTTTASPSGAVLLFHGGSWLYGNPRVFYPQCQYFAEQGYHCFSAQYRLGFNNRVDVRELMEDTLDAFSYLQDHASELNLDPNNIIAGGGSSGGQLAATLGVSRVKLGAGSSRPAGLLLYNPMLDLSPGKPDHHLVKEYWKSVSPHHLIDELTPPTLILVGSEDPEVPLSTAQAYCDSAYSHGRRCDLEVYEGQSHGFFIQKVYMDKTNLRALEFLNSLPL